MSARGTLTLCGLVLLAGALWLLWPEPGDGAVVQQPIKPEATQAGPGDLEPLQSSRAQPQVLVPRTGETATAELHGAAAGPLMVTVHHAHGVAATGARVGLYTPDRNFVAEGILDAQAAWTHDGIDGPAVLFVVGVTPRATRFELERALGEHILTLPLGAVITGHVLVNGVPPGEPIPIAFSQGRDQRWGDSLAKSALARANRALSRVALPGELMSETGDTSSRGFFTTPSGAFVVSGLAPGVETWFWGPGGWSLDKNLSPAMPMTGPADGVVLNLKRPESTVFGRVLDLRGQPVPGAPIRVRLTDQYRGWKQSESTDEWFVDRSAYEYPRFEEHADAEGRFMLALPFGKEPELPAPGLDAASAIDLIDVEIVASGPNGARARVVLEGMRPQTEHDVGDLIVQTLPQYLIQVIGEDGVPVGGAQVRLDHEDGELAWIDRTNDEGVARIDTFDVRFGTLTVVAQAYDTARVQLADEQPDQPIIVRLTPAVVLTMLVEWPVGFQDAEGWNWRFDLWGESPLFNDALLPPAPGVGNEDVGNQSEMRLAWAGTEFLQIQSGDPSNFLMGYESTTDSMTVEGLRPGSPLRPELMLFRAPESFGRIDSGVKWTGDTLWLEPGEHRTIRVDMTHLAPQR